jgi:glycosyltransferase involved in cell wall biosynthesis
MIVHLYAQSWNDAWMLPYFFRHYDPLVDRYFIYDDGSTDETWALLQRHPKVTARRFVRTVPESFTLSGQAFSNECWKESRGQADWVILTDLDEHLYHADGRDYLARSLAQGVTMIPALGFLMLSETTPAPDEVLCRDRTFGVFEAWSQKPSVFSPASIEDMNFDLGRHQAAPKGRVQVPLSDEMLLFHYRYMGFERTHERHLVMRQGLTERDVHNGWCHRYSWSKEEFREDWERTAKVVFDTRQLLPDVARHYPGPLWWETYRSNPGARTAAT